ncbi:hypothetical protein OKW98_09815 [Pseudomonas sp. KU26590]|uniref:hypothetical protein n=1 Tax=Pseudomonas sp. KU26590 TaxID=2991051 RepID=UPI00223E8350|nr:hypothetical protein [Pseudomonas sp. KU26590]UZJ61971.1 hypothetical protein OKW98_09815 [Pseudomonas sp. KU26590]
MSAAEIYCMSALARERGVSAFISAEPADVFAGKRAATGFVLDANCVFDINLLWEPRVAGESGVSVAVGGEPADVFAGKRAPTGFVPDANGVFQVNPLSRLAGERD